MFLAVGFLGFVFRHRWCAVIRSPGLRALRPKPWKVGQKSSRHQRCRFESNRPERHLGVGEFRTRDLGCHSQSLAQPQAVRTTPLVSKTNTKHLPEKVARPNWYSRKFWVSFRSFLDMLSVPPFNLGFDGARLNDNRTPFPMPELLLKTLRLCTESHVWPTQLGSRWSTGESTKIHSWNLQRG
jgi:hypothetical protein